MNVDTFLEHVEKRQCSYRYEPYNEAMANTLKMYCPAIYEDAKDSGFISNQVANPVEFLAWLEGRIY